MTESLANIDIGLNLYSVRDQFAVDPETTLTRLAEMGYQNVEWFGGFRQRTPEEWRETLDSLGLRAIVAHVDLATLLSDDLTEVFDAYRTLGSNALIAPFLAPEQRLDLDVFERVGARLDLAGYQARTRGLRIGYHNHDFEFTLPMERGQSLDGLEQILSRSSSGNVGIELDVFWAAWAGLDPVETIERISCLPGRLSWLHLKDGTLPTDRLGKGFSLPYEDTPFCPLGEGELDLAAIVGAAAKARVLGIFIEQDFCQGDSILVAGQNLRTLEDLLA